MTKLCIILCTSSHRKAEIESIQPVYLKINPLINSIGE